MKHKTYEDCYKSGKWVFEGYETIDWETVARRLRCKNCGRQVKDIYGYSHYEDKGIARREKLTSRAASRFSNMPIRPSDHAT